MKWGEFWKTGPKKQEDIPPPVDAENPFDGLFPDDDIPAGEGLNGKREDETRGEAKASHDPASIDELLKSLEEIGAEMRQPGNPDFADIPDDAPEPEEKPKAEPTGRNQRDAKALVEIHDWGAAFGMSKYAKEPGDDLFAGMQNYQATDDEKEDLTEDLADLLQDAGIELPPGVKFAFTYLRVYGPRIFLAHMNRKLHQKMEAEFARQKTEIKAEFETMKQQFRDEMAKKYQPPAPNPEKEPENTPKEPEKDKEPEDYRETTTAADGSSIYEKEQVAARYDQFRVKTHWEYPENTDGGPYAEKLRELAFTMIGELGRGEKIILDLLRDNFSPDRKPLQTAFRIPKKGSSGRKSDYEISLLKFIGQLHEELKETVKKISILKTRCNETI